VGPPRRVAEARRGHAGRAPDRVLLLVLAAGLAALAPQAATACEPPPGFEASRRVASDTVTILFRTLPAPLEVGRHFAVETLVCPSAPAGVSSSLRVDAQMPEHRHGMNYRPRVTRRSDGVYVAEGLLFHMPGRWRLLFHVERGGRAERLAADIVLE
jgi:hypothetical protein